MRSLRLVFFAFACILSSASSFAQSATRTLAGAGPNPSVVGQRVTLTADVDALGGGGPPTGIVYFKEGATTLGWAPLRSVAAGVGTLSGGGGGGFNGGGFNCALTTAGGVKCWGFNGAGALGDGTTTGRLKPVAVSGLASGVASVVAGGGHACAVTSAGALLCWGWNIEGELGDGTTTTRLVPTPVVGLSSNVVAVSGGLYHSCAATRSGAAFCWGTNGFGQLGDGTTTPRLTRARVAGLADVKALAVGLIHSCALTGAGAVKCWGANAFYELGDGTGTGRPTPVGVVGLSSGVVAISTSGHTTCAITSAGGLRCWGRNWYGGLGDGTTFNRNAPVGVLGLSGPVISVAVALDHTCAVTVAGAVQCWGRNNLGQLGDYTTTDRHKAVTVAGLSSGAVAVAVGEYHSCALLRTGGVRCWGYNAAGQLGDGTTTSRRTPVVTRAITTLLRARAQFSTTTLAAGLHALKAAYPGDAAHGASASVVYQKVN